MMFALFNTDTDKMLVTSRRKYILEVLLVTFKEIRGNHYEIRKIK